MRNRSTSSAVGTRRIRPRWIAGVAMGLASSLLSALIAAPGLASDKLVLVPDYGLFGLFGESYVGDLWIMIALFVLLIFPLNELIFKPIFRSLDERAARIEGARSRSIKLQHDADEVLEQYESAIREARGESEKARQGQLLLAREEQATLTSQARGESEAELERARLELGQSLEEARAILRASAEDLATIAAEQVLGRSLS